MPSRLLANPLPRASAIAALVIAAAASATTERVSVTSGGIPGLGPSSSASLTADGSLVVFASDATNLVAGDANGATDIFLHDPALGTTERISLDVFVLESDGASTAPRFAGLGRYVAFVSSATDLVTGDGNGVADVFVRDLVADTTTRVSVTSAGTEVLGASFAPAISEDGRFVVFTSYAATLVAGDTNGVTDIFVHDRDDNGTGTFDQPGGIATTRVSVDPFGFEANAASTSPSISADGQYVVFTSTATNLAGGDRNLASDVFFHDRDTGQTDLVSVNTAGFQGDADSSQGTISADGNRIVFTSTATNLDPADASGRSKAFVRGRASGVTALVSRTIDGTPANDDAFASAISGDGAFVTYASAATNLVTGDTGGSVDLFRYDVNAFCVIRVTVSTLGNEANNDTFISAIDADGSHVVYDGAASNLVVNDTNLVADAFLFTAKAFTDCNANGTDDDCELATGAVPDCDLNGIPDSCDIAGGEPDCDANGIPDTCDIAGGALDCDGNGIPDTCDLAGGVPDCNANGIPDVCDITSGFSDDCNANGVPDDCDLAGAIPDCDSNGVPDSCDIAAGDAEDCDLNGIPDTCDIAGGAPDCDLNGVPDACDIAAGDAEDCNVNGVPDDCDVAGAIPDCNVNGIPDSCDIVSGAAEDCNANGIPDSCDVAGAIPDCNANGIPDSCDIVSGASEDCDVNGVPDSCDITGGAPDCDLDAVPDACAIASGAVEDCDANGVPDSCDIAGGTLDCDLNGIPDTCDLAGGAPDCNANGIPDTCDIAIASSQDCNGDTIPDECGTDCNGNGIADTCDIAGGASDDCDGNEVPDECETFYFSETSPPLTPFGDGAPGTYTVSSPPVVTPQFGAEVLVTVTASADLSALTESIDVCLNGTSIGTVFVADGSDCPGMPDSVVIALSSGEFVELVGTGDAVFDLTATTSVDAGLCASFVTVQLEYQSVTVTDCNGNDVPDTCDLLFGESDDRNGNGVPDECDPCPDFDDDSFVTFSDLIALLFVWGACPDCPEDLDGDDAVGFGDVLMLISEWGLCPPDFG